MMMPDRKPTDETGESPVEFFKPNDGRTLGLMIALLAFVDVVVLMFLPAITFRGHRTTPGWIGDLIFDAAPVIWMVTVGSLIGVWVGLGNDRLAIRLGAVGVPSLALMQIRPIADGIAAIAMYFLIVALPLLVLRFAGFEFKAHAAVNLASSRQRRDFQFSIKQLLAWTIVASIAALLVRSSGMIRAASISWRDTIQVGIVDMARSLICLAAVCATLMPRTRSAAQMAVLAASIFAAIVAVVAIQMVYRVATPPFRNPRPDESGMIAFAAVCHSLLIAVTFLLFRRIGYRLWRVGADNGEKPLEKSRSAPIVSLERRDV
jgi:hypothetical protein